MILEHNSWVCFWGGELRVEETYEFIDSEGFLLFDGRAGFTSQMVEPFLIFHPLRQQLMNDECP